ncbi:RSA4 [Lepeophtheirus salmonis]|uniref:RSA4 n=1 Tax=Lepeophtheirus salmonis TaxID=72036 RepID=A0A7R8H6F7_LEPSM|nr:RSA4 [Lepeophtheirus salmonis]CAF2896182.1 RSA4 [Lepeophtheirus salmonis]
MEPMSKRRMLAGTEGLENLIVQFVDENGDAPFSPFTLPLGSSPQELTLLVKAFLSKSNEDSEDEDVPFTFFVQDYQIKSTLRDALQAMIVESEKTLDIIFKPEAIFKVSPVSRCTSSLCGHGEPVIVASFSPNGQYLASGSGDATVRFWDLSTETPHFKCEGHIQWVLALAWAPDGSRLASGDRRGGILLWDPKTGNKTPLHLSGGESKHFASASKDGDIRIWDIAGRCLRSLTSHTQNVTCLKWGGSGLIYSASQDRTIKVWRASDGTLCRTLQGHGHWVNVLALNTDYVIRTGAFDPAKASLLPRSLSSYPKEELKKSAELRYNHLIKSAGGTEILVSGSDDFTLFLWKPETDKKSYARLTGHQQTVNDVKFSPDARYIASASFDKSIRLWDGRTGKFMAVFRGHVQAVYQLAWSLDSRLIVSGSADSTVKLWSVKNKKLHTDLPGHGADVYCVDWSPDGQRVVSGGKDKVLKLWKKIKVVFSMNKTLFHLHN